MKRRSFNVFTLSFLDCISCGLGAVILLFVIVNAQSEARRDEVTVDLRAETERMEREVLDGKKLLVQLRNTLEDTSKDVVTAQGRSRRLISNLELTQEELAVYRDKTLAAKAHVNQLKADLKSKEEDLRRLKAGAQQRKEAGEKLRTFPGQGDRHYLTDLKVGGKRILMLVDASASMLDETVVGVIRRRNQKESDQRRAPKWRHTVATVDWLMAQLPPKSSFQIYTFNETAKALIPDTAKTWLAAEDATLLNRAADLMRKVVPKKGTSLINAISVINGLSPKPDNVFLVTDGLPTMGTSVPWRKRVSGKKRQALFNDAIRKLSPRIPVNVILLPMEGDPRAPSAYWRMATLTRGSFFCPPKDWP
jgi:hypothetical protein